MSEEIVKDIRQILPHFSKNQAEAVRDSLAGAGFNAANDLKYVEFDDLRSIGNITRADCRKLASHWRSESSSGKNFIQIIITSGAVHTVLKSRGSAW